MMIIRPWPALLLLATLAGCLGAPVAPMTEAPLPPAPPPVSASQPDQIILEEALRGRALGNGEVVELSDRLLQEGNSALSDQTTMARLEILLLKALKTQDKVYRPAILRNLGIIHYHQGKYKKARQELQHSNELNPREPRTHFYLARIFSHQGEIYQKQGKKSLSRQQFKRASIEMEVARKLAPNNSTYRQDLQQIIRQEQGK
ncbi:MAG: tetratricopeptide repeat protein [Deltaproteobacteria bacterium]|nr:tetratricopeptide repeat protein [Deltaproteobacteria bacterium]MBI4794685.1 tetratricopeptide repeat protein [Deltaproteobacteria bacterium]